MKTELHLARLPVIHSQAQFVVRHKLAVSGAKGIKHVPVVRRDLVPKHDGTDHGSCGKADLQIKRAEAKHQKTDDCAHQSHGSYRHGGIVLCTGGDEAFLCFIHLTNQGIGGLKVEQKLPSEQIVGQPAGSDHNAGEEDLDFHYFAEAMSRVSRAITSSSLVGITKTFTLESGVEIMMSSPRFLLASSSTLTPR